MRIREAGAQSSIEAGSEKWRKSQHLFSTDEIGQEMNRFLVGALMVPLLSAMCIPGIESLTFRIPDFSELTRSEGIARFDTAREFKRGACLLLDTPTETIAVSCRVASNEDVDCIRRDERSTVAQQHVVVWWSEQPIFLFAKEKRAFQIEVNGRVLHSYSSMVLAYDKRTPNLIAVGSSLLGFLCLLFLVAYFLINKRPERDS